MRKPEFTEAEMQKIRSSFYYVDRDMTGEKRVFMDNAGGSLRLRAAEEAFRKTDSIPDCSEHANRTALLLLDIETRGRRDLQEVIFGTESGVVFPGGTASSLMMEICRIFAENAAGTNVVTTMLEHPSAYDGMKMYAEKYGRELRVAPVNAESGGVDADAVLSLIDKDTAILCCMAASNISGYVYDLEKICRTARKINPEILIICDAVQHAPHAWIDPEGIGADAMTFAPYKFFGIRGLGAGWISGRAASFAHHRLLGKSADEWELGSPAPAHYAAISAVVDYVVSLAGKDADGGIKQEIGDPQADMKRRRELFRAGMDRIAARERYLLEVMLEGTEKVPGLRHIPGVTVRMDGAPIEQRDLITGIELSGLSCVEARKAYDERGIVVFERSAESIYSKRMVEAFGSEGMVRISPLHVNTKEEMEEFLAVTRDLVRHS